MGQAKLFCLGLGLAGHGGLDYASLVRPQQGLWPLPALPIPMLVLSRRKSKQALRDYKKVQIQLENLESSVRDRCKKEFTGEAAEILHSRAQPKPAVVTWDPCPNLSSSARQTL